MGRPVGQSLETWPVLLHKKHTLISAPVHSLAEMEVSKVVKIGWDRDVLVQARRML